MEENLKQLLLKDLCARFPYGVKAELHGEVCTVLGYYNDFDFDDFVILTSNTSTGQQTNIANIKPYLRPMSSMTEEEEIDFTFLLEEILSVGKNDDTCILSVGQIDWLNAHHFDYRGLIEKGLALEAPDNMYKQ